MYLQLNLQSEVPIYTQILHQIMEGIARKELKPGEPLPSVRSLASDIGVNLHTVNKAYNLLKQGGYVQVHRKSGVIVNPDPIPAATEEDLERIQAELRPLISEAICKGLSEDDFEKLYRAVYRDILN
ncbi:GntR family transcriptional regulator [Paenibacillus swuensis]|uniref:GntR family transcriptional regulator n=1 Tax=Paenibacillus swuensis TaxID=1178515 RepID=A0A172TFL4_9BACL|nr:GntR family transcriptional regulator [Paenibacillus swuensis]ANE45694.1 GntR family transcriptional regulator [Paenibacillus swuensis]